MRDILKYLKGKHRGLDSELIILIHHSRHDTITPVFGLDTRSSFFYNLDRN
jgi:hypothetical protein